MRDRQGRWKLEELIDFEVALGAWDGVSRMEVAPAGNRRVIFRQWLEQAGGPRPGRLWTGGLGWAALLLGVAAFWSGAGAAWSSLVSGMDGVHVVIFLTATLFVPWLIMLAGLLAWVFRPARGGLLGPLLAWLAGRFSGKRGALVAERLQDSAGLAKAAGWRIASGVQGAMAMYHLGAAAGLLAMVFFRKVGFFWETTTERAMERVLENTVEVLAWPWQWVPGLRLPEVAATRRMAEWHGGGDSWWPFLVLALLVWGVLPRLLLRGVARLQEWRTLRSLVFQSPRERKLWRVLNAVERGEEPEAPTDGALVIDIGGMSVSRDAMRPWFLRRLRMNPVAWESLGVLDRGREASASAALAKAKAGVILLAEGWSLAPRQMESIIRSVADASSGRRVICYVANFGGDGKPAALQPAERESWAAFIDSLRDTEVEVVFHEEEQTWAAG